MLKNNFIQNNTLVGLTSSSDGVDTQPAGVSLFMAKYINETGNVYGMIKVISFSHIDTRMAVFNCLCECGNSVKIHGSRLRRGGAKSCGCTRLEKMRLARTTHGMTSIFNKVPEYANWESMKDRCYNGNCPAYKHYGGRGIIVCDRWKSSFESFYADMGSKPTPKHSIDRIDVNGNYEPSNCRWANQSEQMNNTRSNVLITFNNQTLNITQWAKVTGIANSIISWRIKKGWSIEKSLTQKTK